MNDYKSIQDIIVRAALYDRITTTITPDERIGGVDVLKVTFSRDDRYSTAYIDMNYKYNDRAEMALYCCKRALCDLLCAPYEEITCPKENYNERSS